MRLFIFPHAGAISYSYTSFRNQFPRDVDIQLLEMPGRGRKIGQRLVYDIEELAGKLYEEIKEQLDMPYGMLGHSMGSLVAYLVIRRIALEKATMPVKFFSSSALAPSLISNDRRFMLPSDKFWGMILALGGASREVLINDEVRQVFEPILRADFQALETYRHRTSAKLNLPIVVLRGLDDRVSYRECLCWQEETNKGIKIYQFDGDHFYILKNNRQVANAILTELMT